jgi:membrane associated rhomboid family serine protease
MWSVTTWLIVINVAVFVINPMTGNLLWEFGAFTVDTAVKHLQLWRFITFQFLHVGTTHLIFNMISLYFFGPMIESYLGTRRYLAFYLLCGVSGAALFLILWQASAVSTMGAEVTLIGASAGIFGILVAGAVIAPNATVMLLFPPIPMRLKTLALVLIGIEVFTILESGPFAGGQLGHLGGAGLGYLLIRKPQLLDVFDRPFTRRKKKRFFMDDWR